MRGCHVLALVCCLLPALTGPAAAQPRTLVVPEGATVVVPPRGGAMPPSAEARVTAPRPAFNQSPPPAAGGDLVSPGAMAALAVLPLAVAGAVLATTLPGSGGGASGPVRTR